MRNEALNTLAKICRLGVCACLTAPAFAMDSALPFKGAHAAGSLPAHDIPGQFKLGETAKVVKDVPRLTPAPGLARAGEAPQPAKPAGPEAAKAQIQALSEGVAAMPDLSKADAGSAARAGWALEDATTGSHSRYGEGEPAADLESQVKAAAPVLQKVRAEARRAIVGQKELIDAIIMAVIVKGHILLEGVPGVGKTQTVKTIADAVDGKFGRIQGTPDKLPSDIIGAEIYREDTREFELVKGPIFVDLLLADEINRMPAKTQSALLEMMGEGQVTVGKHTLKNAATVIATQNPVEQEGTYPLSEAQEDRFLFKVTVEPYDKQELVKIMRMNASKSERPKARKVASLEELGRLRGVAEKIPVSEAIESYIADIALAARVDAEIHKSVSYTVDTRAAQAMLDTARAHALMEGRAWVGPEDVKYVAPMVLRHRIRLTYEAKQAGMTVDKLIQKILERVELPQAK